MRGSYSGNTLAFQAKARSSILLPRSKFYKVKACMVNKKLSRSTEIDTELCVKNAGGNKYNLVLIASARARELTRQHQNGDRKQHHYPILTALLDIQDGKVGIEYLKKIR